MDSALSDFLEPLGHFAIVPLTIDRLIALKYPLLYTTTKHHRIVSGTIIFSWIAGILNVAANHITAQFSEHQYISFARPDCGISYHFSDIFTSYFRDIVFYVAPVTFAVGVDLLFITYLTRGTLSRFQTVTVVRALAVCVVNMVFSLPMLVILKLSDVSIATRMVLVTMSYLNTFLDPILYAVPVRWIMDTLRLRTSVVSNSAQQRYEQK